MSINLGLLVQIKAKPGKEAAMEAFLKSGLALANAEAGTAVWFAVRLGPSTFGVFDAFADEAGRQSHLNGAIAAALFADKDGLLAETPTVQTFDVLAVKLPS